MLKKKIWIICHYATPQKYGYGTRQFLLAEEYLKMGYEVTVFASPSNYQINVLPVTKGMFTREVLNGVEVVWVKGIRYSNPAGLKRVFSWFVFSFFLMFYPCKRSELPGIIVVSSLSLITVLNGWFLKMRSPDSQFIFEIRDIWPQTLIDVGGYSRFHPLVMLLGWIEKAGYKRADNIVATMPRADLHIAKRIKKEFKFTCIPQGIDLLTASQDLELTDTEKEAYFPQSGFIVGYAGAFGRSNSLDTIIRTAHIIAERSIGDICFVLVGDGSEKENLIQLAKGLKNVYFIPRISKKKIQSFLSNCTILHDSVMPVNLYSYGLSRNKWMDYMLSGKPMVVSYSGHVSLINEAGCGIVVPAGDPERLAAAILEYYYMDRGQLEETGRKGREFVLENRTFAKLASDYRKIFWF
jgi:glycosyltransferase involved in cell wall biosynthesis